MQSQAQEKLIRQVNSPAFQKIGAMFGAAEQKKADLDWLPLAVGEQVCYKDLSLTYLGVGKVVSTVRAGGEFKVEVRWLGGGTQWTDAKNLERVK